MLPIFLLLGGALALIGVLPTLPPTFNVELFHGTSLMTPDVMDALLVYLPSSPAIEGTVAVVGDIVDSTTGVVKDIVNTIQNSAVLASSDLIWFSDMSFSGTDFGYYGYYGPDYFLNVDLLFVDTLGGRDMAGGTGDLLALDPPFLLVFDEADRHNGTCAADVNNDLRVYNKTTTAVVGVANGGDVDGSCDGGSDCLHQFTEYEMLVLLVAVSIYCLPGILAYIGRSLCWFLGTFPIGRWIMDDLAADYANMPRLFLLLAYVAAGMYLLEESLGGPLFYDPFARISWLMERGWIDTMPMTQEFLILYLWAWWKVVVTAERTRARMEMGMDGVGAVGEWVLHDKDNGAHLRTSGSDGLSGPWTLKVLRSFDEDLLQTCKLVDRDPKTRARRPYVKPETTVLFGDLD